MAAAVFFFAAGAALAGLPFRAFCSFLIKPLLAGAGFLPATTFLAAGLATGFDFTSFFAGAFLAFIVSLSITTRRKVGRYTLLPKWGQ
ncbi:hypothetical protein [Solimonas terrae]|uniref:Uncharacterized protein n=1 Tax=Solimonas terrae TaxID=1396819 RepID=A0A6M2BLP4_9GAMM|nr:hypothetical protein [Solimonas terrae]NGY03388.1 hypothetical protein [Solimonas terrae]